MRVLKEVLVLALLVLAFAYGARLLEGVDAGRIESGVPSFSKSLRQLFGREEQSNEPRTPPAVPTQEQAAP